MATAFDGFQYLGQDNVQTAMNSLGAFTKGFQRVATEIVDYNKTAFERSTAFLQNLAQARDVGQAVQIQTNYLRSSYDDLASEMEKLSGIWKEVALEATKAPARPAPKQKVQ
ncbi:MAG TPA: phasin family protein [Alphaproteobacteria bacterium]|nr:phasin family protein [Alphaproteobacteria bacterium]